MMSDLHRLRRYSYKGEGDEIAELIGDIHWAADEIERLTDDVAALGQECIDLRLTTRDKPPWMMPPLDEWSIVGMNHYHVGGERRLFVSMARDGRCIKAEGVDDEYLWNRLWHQATESSDEDMVANATIERNGDLEREIESLTALVAELGAGLCEAMDWNWLDDGAEEDIPCFNKLQALAKLREKDDE
jgi:hypothetical protein